MAASVARIEVSGPVSMTEDQMLEVLRNSLYPGARLDSIRMVMSYCQAAKLDVLQKPVHIVPMPVPTGRKDSDGWDIKEYRDVVMPGIGLYRTQASRTQQYAGLSEPEFGEEVTQELGGVEVTFPKWCRVTVEKIVGGKIRQFSAKEFWLENYATKSNKSIAPNAMWRKRPYAQIAKCTEAQALRKAFPDTVGAAPTAEEMEGKELDLEMIDGETGEIVRGKPQVTMPLSRSEQSRPAIEHQETESFRVPVQPQKETAALLQTGGGASGAPATAGEKAYLAKKCADLEIDMTQALAENGLASLDNLTTDGFSAMKKYFASVARARD